MRGGRASLALSRAVGCMRFGPGSRQGRTRELSLATALIPLLVLGACREGTSTFEAVDRIDESESLPRQLGWKDDRPPDPPRRWNDSPTC